MKVGIITQPNIKGQIVIPKILRDELNITSDTHLQITIQNGSLSIKPIQLISDREKNDAYIELLKKTQGAWEKEDLSTFDKRKEKEIQASQKNRKSW